MCVCLSVCLSVFVSVSVCVYRLLVLDDSCIYHSFLIVFTHSHAIILMIISFFITDRPSPDITRGTCSYCREGDIASRFSQSDL